MEENRYTAEMVADILKERGFPDITTRTVNYYAFDKKMFQVNERGKNIFTDTEVEKIIAIKKLKEHTSFTLEQIRDIINTKDFDSIMEFCQNHVRAATTDNMESGASIYFRAPATDNVEPNGCLSSFSAYGKGVVRNTAIQSCPETDKSQNAYASGENVVRVNEDCILILGSRYDNAKTEKIITFINNLENNSFTK